MASYDIIGNVVVVKFKKEDSKESKVKFAEEFLESHRIVKTVLEKTGKVKGRLRTPTTKFIAGMKTKEALYKESGCVFRLNVDTCYFSPRLSSDRLDVSSQVKKGENVLVMFGGVGPYPIVIAKNSEAKKVISVELGKECCKYAEENVSRNKLKDKVEIIQGDVRRVLGTHLSAVNSKEISSVNKIIPKLDLPKSGIFKRKGFDRIMMARPNLNDSFLDVAFSVIKKGGIIHYHGFYPMDDVEVKESKAEELIFSEAKKAGKKIKILNVKRAGEIGVKTFRYRIDFRVL